MRFSLRLACMFTIVACLCLPFGASAAENPLQAVFARIDQESAKFKGMTADMRRLSHEGVINEDDPPDIGTIAVKIPKPHDVQMLIEFKQPDPKAVEISGSKVFIYYPKAGEVQEYNLGKARRGQ